MLSFSSSYTGTGSNATVSGIPFDADVVLVKAGGSNTNDAMFITKTMPANWCLPVRSDLGLLNNRLLSITSTGFTLGTNNDVNQNGVTYYYLALADDGAGDFSTIFFQGDSTDDKLVFTAWQPDYALLKSEVNVVGARKFSGQISATGNSASNKAMPNFQTAVARTDLISFASDGMRVSNGSSSGGDLVNRSGYNTYGFVLKNVSGLINSGSYTGTGSATTVTTGVNPIFIDVHSDVNGRNPTIQFQGEQAGGLTSAWDSAPSTGKIASVTATGFDVSTDVNVNSSGATYWYMTLGQKTTTQHNLSGISTLTGAGSVTF